MIKGLCKVLGAECPMDAMDPKNSCMTDAEAATDFRILEEWAKVVATNSVEKASTIGPEFLGGRGLELAGQLSKSSIECESRSTDIKLINEKLGVDIWSEEWYLTAMEYPKEFPLSFWHFKKAEHEFVKNNDPEAMGVALGLDWYHVAQWHKERLGKKARDLIDL